VNVEEKPVHSAPEMSDGLSDVSVSAARPHSRPRDVLRQLPLSVTALAALIVLGVVFSVASPRFLTTTNLLTILNAASVVGILALGMTVVLIAGGIDLSVGSAASLTTVLLSQFLLVLGLPIPLALVCALLVGALMGLANGLVVVKARVPPIIVTLGTMAILRAFADYASGSQVADLSKFQSLLYLGQGYFGPVPVPGILLLVLAVVMQILLTRATVFRRFQAIGANPAASWLMGLPVGGYTVAAFVVSGLFAALAGVVLTGQLAGSTPNAGYGLELPAITAAVLGGTNLRGGSGSAIGSLIGALLLSTIFNGLILLGFSPFAQQVATGAILAAALTLNEWLRRQAR
jgi:ribose transport system permease protein